MTIVLDLPRQIDEALAADIEKESAFVSPYLAGLKVNNQRTNIAVELTDSGKDAEVRDKVERFLDAMLKRVHQFETKVFLKNERKDQGPFHQDVHAELKNRGWLHDYGAGHVALNGPPLHLARALDAARCRGGPFRATWPAPKSGNQPRFFSSAWTSRWNGP